MKIPRYIVIKLEMVGKDTVAATNVTDRCEVYEYEPNCDAPLPCHKCESALSSECTACDGQKYFRTEEGDTDCPWK